MTLSIRAGAKWSASLLLATVVCSLPLAQQLTVTPKKRYFSIAMRTVFTRIPPELQNIDFWFPSPFQDDAQGIYNRYILTAYGPEFRFEPDTGNEFIYVNSPARGGAPMSFRLNFDVERLEDLRNDFRPREDRPSAEEEKKIFDRWLSRMVIDSRVKKLASKITSGKKKPLEKARAIYDHIIAEFALEGNAKLVNGPEHGYLARVIGARAGNSVDLAAAFVGLCRAVEIPARSVVGFKIPSGVETGTLRTYDGWAEFYLEGIGWVPVDPADGQRYMARRSYYFGALDENRMTVSIGRDIMLLPPQQGDPLNYFIVPYWEGDAQPMALPDLQWVFTALTEIPGNPVGRIPSPARVQEKQQESPPEP